MEVEEGSYREFARAMWVCEMCFLKGKIGIITDKGRKRDAGPGKEQVGRKGGREREKRGEESASVFQEVRGVIASLGM